ncbi:basic leucine zipper transcription factor domain-containing protein [Trichoderma citrinoviride]|uniref:Basic leucine zipper transcription factor domain-containing protein n=1 Tax=Trichoderma citrinoviride TaxID=58853 RepID=A0A2T4B0P9_9HYPO|nr:basic leucine zipper transcription factor domain-containing protein [Trichoderma citrinoviride]PTB62801.1 basic leucine zipper transcription factor domain-containing protein [Trichoderma citrinoviride]
MSTTQRATSLSQSPGPRSNRSSNCSSPPKKSKPGDKHAEWSQVTDPEERRRIQNRIAQRKFRGKVKEQKERAEREAKDKEHAGNSYRIPEPDDIDAEPELSGLPWGSVSLSHIVARGHEAESRKSSGRGTYLEDSFASNNYSPSFSSDVRQTASYGSSGVDDSYRGENQYVYDAPGFDQAYSILS